MKSIYRALLLTILVAPVAGSLGAQAPVQETTFQIASVKALPTYSFMNISYDHVSLPGITVKGLLMYAYKLRLDQILGSPEWTSTEFWAIRAKPPAGTDLTQADTIRKMLQSLLEDRFRLKVHLESKEAPLDVLVIDSIQRPTVN